jgi:hypothetical protein
MTLSCIAPYHIVHSSKLNKGFCDIRKQLQSHAKTESRQHTWSAGDDAEMGRLVVLEAGIKCIK